MRRSPRVPAGEPRGSGSRCERSGVYRPSCSGRWPEADDWIDAALASETRWARRASWRSGARALLDLGRGSLDSAAEHLEIVLLMCQNFTATAYGWTELYSSIALLSIARGQPSEAIDSVRESLARSAAAGARRPHARLPPPGDPCRGGPRRGGSPARRCGRIGGGARDRPRVRRTARSPRAARARAAGRRRPAPRPRRGAWQGRAEPAHGSLERGRVGHRGGRGGRAAASPRGRLQPIPSGRGAPAIARARGPLRRAAALEAHRIARDLGATPLQREVERLAARSRLDLASPPVGIRRSFRPPSRSATRSRSG